MKKLLLISFLSLGLVSAAMAGNHHTEASRMAKRLDVTESQMPTFNEVMQAQTEKRQRLMEEFRAQQVALEAETAAELAGVLTPEQLTKLADMKTKRAEQRAAHSTRGERGHHGRRGGEWRATKPQATE